MVKKPTKYVFVTGGVLSGLGKGITAASIGNLLKARGLKINIQKCDPYLNVDAGTLNPAEHGECFVTKDGAETDLDLGHYERFLDIELTRSSSLMSGRVLQKVIHDERSGKYLGKTVQFIPHVTRAIAEEIELAAEGFDVHIVEIGGTVGDYEGLSFIEAIRELSLSVGRSNCVFVHVVYLPYLGASHEVKTKPAQNAVRELRGLGIVPDILVARSEESIASKSIIHKLSMYSGIETNSIVQLPNADSIYEVPLLLENAGIGQVIASKLKLKTKRPNLKSWEKLVQSAKDSPKNKLTIGVVAKYLDNQDTYMSVFEALKSAAWSQQVGIKIKWIEAELLDKPNAKPDRILRGLDGIVVPGGFGPRGVEGKIKAAQYALKKNLPYLGLCLGMQVGVIAAARNAGLEDANSTEINPATTNPVINTMNDQIGKENTGGSMRLGDYECLLQKDTKTAKLYKVKKVSERHRHRYECNNDYRDQYEEWGIIASGTSPDGSLVEIIEAKNHQFFIASQFHPEFKSRPNHAHPLFKGFINSLLQTKK